jgi:hypothetical protein
LSDAIIESQILTNILKKCGIKASLGCFPFEELGKTTDYAIEKKSIKYMNVVKIGIENWLDNATEGTSFYSQMQSHLARMEYHIEQVRGF